MAQGFTGSDTTTNAIIGPSSATDNALVRYNGTTGKSAQDSTVIVTDNGEMTNGSQPAFLGVLSGVDADVTGNGTTYTIGTNTSYTEVYDQGGDFVTTGTFTAPVTGRYFLSSQARFTNATSYTAFDINIVTSNRNYQQRAGALGTIDTTLASDSFSDMDVADTALVQVTMSGLGGDTADMISSNSQTRFSGALLC